MVLEEVKKKKKEYIGRGEGILLQTRKFKYAELSSSIGNFRSKGHEKFSGVHWYTQNCSEEVFAVSKIKNTVPWTYVISDLNDEPITGILYEKELQKTNQKEFRVEKVFKRKGGKLYVKLKGYDN